MYLVSCALSKISLTSSKADEWAEAAGLTNAIQTFEFSFQIVLQDKLLSTIDAVSQYLQRENMSFFEALFLLESALTTVKQQRSEFDELKKTAVTLSLSLGTVTTFKEIRVNRKKKFFDELCEDERLADAELHYKVSVFNTNKDIVISQLSASRTITIYI